MLIALAVAGCSRQSQPTTAGTPADSSQTASLSAYFGQLRSVAVSIGSATHRFIFDTGGGETMITPELASAIGCAPYGRAVGFRMSGEQVSWQYCDDVSFQLGDITIAPDRVGVFNLRSLLPAGLPPADGVMSLRSFRHRPVTIDYARGEITVETVTSLKSRVAGMRSLTIRIASGLTGAETTAYIAGRIGGQRVWLALDSGNVASPLLVAPNVARVANCQSPQCDVLVHLDGLDPVRLSARTSNIVYDGVIGAAFMKEWILTLDLASSRAWAARAMKTS
jgi:hypothetical protein